MTILFLGNFEAEYSSENYYKKTLEAMGHEVVTVQEGKNDAHSLTYELITSGAKLFFWVHTHGWRTPGIEDFLQKCRELGVKSFAYHLDLYMGIQRETQLYKDPFFKVDYFFTVDALMARWLNEQTGYAKGYFVPAGVYEGDCVVGTMNREKYPYEIIFTGSTHYHHEWPYRKKLVEWLKATYGNKFGHYGPGGMESVRGPELNNLYASAKIVIGDTLCKDFTYPHYSSDRLFEVIGRGGFLIYPDIKGLDDFYKDSDDYRTYRFDDFGGLKLLIDHYLTHPEEAFNIRMRGHFRTRMEHTYRHRLQHILNVLA
jgi:hypothetical protein